MMPWIPAHKNYPDTGWPAHYSWLHMTLSDDNVLGHNIEYAKQKRKEAGQLRELLLNAQKECGKRKDIEGARYFRDMAAEYMKEYRGWDSAIKIVLEDANDWTHSHVSEPIAPYVDRSFMAMECQLGDEK